MRAGLRQGVAGRRCVRRRSGAAVGDRRRLPLPDRNDGADLHHPGGEPQSGHRHGRDCCRSVTPVSTASAPTPRRFCPTRLGLPFAVTLPAAGLVAAAIGTVMALPTMRLVSIYFAVATLGIGEMIYVTLLNWTDFTRGPMGIREYSADRSLWLAGAIADAAVYGGRGGGGGLALGAVATDAFLLRQCAARRARGRPVRKRHGAQRRPAQDRRLRDQLLLRRRRRRPARPHGEFHQPGPVRVRRVDQHSRDGGRRRARQPARAR